MSNLPELKKQNKAACSFGFITWSCDASLFLSSSVVRAVRSQAGGDVVRKLSNDNDDAVAEKRQRGPGV